MHLAQRSAVVALLVSGLVGLATASDEGYRSQEQGPPMLGIEMSPTTLSSQAANNLGMDQGVLVRQVFPSTAAQGMGVQPGDVVLSVNGGPIGSMSDLRSEVGFNNVGDPVDVVVSRNGQRIAMRGQFQEWPANIPHEPLDPAVEQRFKDWQRRHLERNQSDVAQLRQSLDQLEDQLAHPGDAAPQPDQAMAEAADFLKHLPAWKLAVRYAVDPADVAAAAAEPVAMAPLAERAPAAQPWRVDLRLDSSHAKPE